MHRRASVIMNTIACVLRKPGCLLLSISECKAIAFKSVYFLTKNLLSGKTSVRLATCNRKFCSNRLQTLIFLKPSEGCGVCLVLS